MQTRPPGAPAALRCAQRQDSRHPGPPPQGRAARAGRCQRDRRDDRSGSGNYGVATSAAMRVLVADSDSEALEAIGRAFEVDVAASKVTCIDLLRANEYDVLVAAERLEDGS